IGWSRRRGRRPSPITRSAARSCSSPMPTIPAHDTAAAARASRGAGPYITRMSNRSYLLCPDPPGPRLRGRVRGVDQTGQKLETRVTVERALTIFLNAQEIVTAMTINDYPQYLALGYLLNQRMLEPDDVVTGIDYDAELAVVVVRTKRKTDYE